MLLDHAIFVIAVATWIAVLGVVVILFVGTARAEGVDVAVRRVATERLAILLLLVAIIVSVASNSVVFIQPQEVGVVSSLLLPGGYRTQQLDSGVHLIFPLVEQVNRFPAYLQNYTVASVADGAPSGSGPIAARTQDGQVVYVEVSMIYSIDRNQVVKIYLDWQDRYVSDLISPLVRGIVRDKVSQFSVDEVNSDRRQELEDEIARALSTDMGAYGFQMKRFLLRNIAFSPEYAAAVEEKQVAFQNVTRDQYRAQQVQILSSAQAAALERLGAALAKNPDVATLNYIEKLAPSITTLLVPSNAPFILPLPTAFSRAGAAPNLTVTPTPFGQATATPTLTSLFPTPVTVGTPERVPTPQPLPTTSP